MNDSERRDRIPEGGQGEKGAGPLDGPSPGAATPATPDGDTHETRRSLLKAGRRLFAARGFQGTSVRTLTSEAAVNLGAVTYHFESKEGLYRAVLEECLGPLRDRVGEVKELPIPPMGRIELLVRGFFRHLSENPDMPRFMVQELVIGESPAAEVAGAIGALLGTLVEILEEGQAEGSIVPGDPVLQALTILSQPIYLSVMPPVLERAELRESGVPLPGADPESHAIAILRRALLAREERSE